MSECNICKNFIEKHCKPCLASVAHAVIQVIGSTELLDGSRMGVRLLWLHGGNIIMSTLYTTLITMFSRYPSMPTNHDMDGPFPVLSWCTYELLL